MSILAFLGIGVKPVQPPAPSEPPEQQLIMELPVSEKYKYVQGGCCSDKYIYELLSDGTESIVCVIDPKTWTEKFRTEPLSVAHGNDMCYNPATDEIMIVHNKPQRKKVSVFDAETMTFKRLVKLERKIFCMDYDADNNVYYAGESFTKLCTRFSSDLVAEESFEVTYEDATTQGMLYHDGKIFYVLYNPNMLRVYDTSGNYLGTYSLPITSGEPENAFFFDGAYYITYNKPGATGGVIYRLNNIKIS